MTVKPATHDQGGIERPAFDFEVGFYFSCLIRNKSDLQNAKNRPVSLAPPDFLKNGVINESYIVDKKQPLFIA